VEASLKRLSAKWAIRPKSRMKQCAPLKPIPKNVNKIITANKKDLIGENGRIKRITLKGRNKGFPTKNSLRTFGNQGQRERSPSLKPMEVISPQVGRPNPPKLRPRNWPLLISPSKFPRTLKEYKWAGKNERTGNNQKNSLRIKPKAVERRTWKGSN